MNFDIPIQIPATITLPKLLLVNALQGTCQEEREIVEKHLSCSEAKRAINRLDSKIPFCIAELKESLVIDSLQLLVDMINKKYISKLENLDLTNAILWQVVEIDWTFQDLCPGDTEIHFEVFTKRGIFLESELHDATGLRVIRDD